MLDGYIDVDEFVAQNGSVELLRLMLPRFVAQAALWLPAFDRAVELDDTPAVLELLHRMRGSCSALHAVQLVKAIRAGEHALQSGAVRLYEQELRQLAHQIRLFTQALTTHTESNRAASAAL